MRIILITCSSLLISTRNSIELTGLRPVFCGQLEMTPYLETIKKRFPARALMCRASALIADFEFLRASRHIVPCGQHVQLAGSLALVGGADFHAGAWRIPSLAGAFRKPAAAHGSALFVLPSSRFIMPCRWPKQAAAHDSLRGLWRKMPAARLGAMLAADHGSQGGAPRDFFDEDFYLATYPDIRAAVGAGHFPSALHHYRGVRPSRGPRILQRRPRLVLPHLSGRGPGNEPGRFAPDPLNHWLELGRFRGYKRQNK